MVHRGLKSRSASPSRARLRAGLTGSTQGAQLGPYQGAFALWGPISYSHALLPVFPLAPYLPRCGGTLRSSYSFTKAVIFLVRQEKAEPELWNEPSERQQDRRTRFSAASTGVFSAARSDTV